ncbi:YgfZ/GcvT domain-containing protein [Aureimonas mangrovi]|uniref:CAF17-like 4Fe-4S cluster assembly/insertion protein YgfZ n=1 Tax=Aureimonas mangrovi TaxID=2758041 RepID=UPI001FE8B300|nr:folate-binding protein [Aureimonas mangrovi]
MKALPMPAALLPTRALVDVTGAEAEHFLQNLVTADIEGLPDDLARPSALLTPQGKILFDFLVSRIDGGFRLDVASSARADLVKRLMLYRLRAKVAIEPADGEVAAVWEADEAPAGALADGRFPGGEVYRLYGVDLAGDSSASDYRAMRIAAGVLEAEADFPAADVFPHDVLLDQNGGVSFKKGCFVGQEVVSRMQHRGTARRRVMVLRAEGHLSEGANVEADGRTVGTLLAAAGKVGAAILRIDKVAEALRGGQTLSVDGVPVEAEVPAWAGYVLPAESEASA